MDSFEFCAIYFLDLSRVLLLVGNCHPIYLILSPKTIDNIKIMPCVEGDRLSTRGKLYCSKPKVRLRAIVVFEY